MNIPKITGKGLTVAAIFAVLVFGYFIFAAPVIDSKIFSLISQKNIVCKPSSKNHFRGMFFIDCYNSKDLKDNYTFSILANPSTHKLEGVSFFSELINIVIPLILLIAFGWIYNKFNKKPASK